MTTLDVASISAIFLPARYDGKYEGEHLKTLQRLGARRKVILLAFPPKAAGTFLRTVMVAATDGQLVRIVQAQGGRDVTPYLPTFINYFNGGVTDKAMVAHGHMLGLPANIHFLEAFGIRPIVMKRSIPDMLTSYWDMLDTVDESLTDGLNCLIPENFRELPNAAKADFLVDVLGPWYANYFASWLAYANAKPDAVLVLDYRDFCDTPTETVQSMLVHAGMPQPQDKCAAALAEVWKRRAEFRFNQGRDGRGDEYFGPSHIERLARILKHYPGTSPYVEELLGVP